MKNHFKNIVLFILFSLSGIGGFGVSAYAQLYPVQLTPIFNSPYSVKIADYATSMDTKMQLLINPNDISINNRQVRLKLFIQGNGINVQSSDYIQGLPPIYINGGELKTITNTDISALFRLENLQGISATQYANPLPEGMYSFCFEMYDYVTNQKISRKSCANLYLILNDPPLLNTPQNKELIAYTEFPNILFTWTPRQINATNVSYQFELKQLFDDTLDPQIGFQMAPVLHQETLFGTALLYNLSKPVLVPGMRYAWRVRAISTSGLSENAVFKNEGYSEIYSFKYTAACVAPSFVLSESQSTKSVKITWQGVPEHTRYQIQYRKEGVRNAQWFSNYSQNTQSLLTDLEPGVTYEFRVGSSCESINDGVQSFTYSGINTFTTTIDNKEVAYNCGIVPEISITNQKPLTNLIQSETFTAGDFPVTILELRGENSPYSGRGYIIVPYLADTKIAVEFNSIVINTDYQLISGVVETSYNPDWKNVTDVEDFTGEGQGGQIEETVPFAVKDIVINANGDIVVNGFDGEQITIPGGKDTVITEDLKDADGNSVPGKVYTVDSKGNGSNEGIAAAPDGKPTPANTDGVDANGQATAFTAQGASIAFTVNSSKYAFDVMPKGAPEALQKLYKKVGGVALPYKAVVNGFSDTLIATLTLTDTIVKPENIVFKTQNGALINATRSDKTFELTVKGNLTYGEEQILATVKQGDKWKVIGAFMLVHISPKEVNVALVPTDKVSEDKLDAIITETQKTYNKVGVKINFKKEGILDISSVVTGNTITTEKNTITSTYSTEQQNINALYKSDSYVLFITNKASSTGQQGYMRLNGQYGYVFESRNSATPAHELGHGIFKLEHPFEQYNTSEKSTDLLMDYSAGTVLNHQDWKQINDPAFKFYGFQSQSSGQSMEIKGFTDDLFAQLTSLPTSNNTCLTFAVGNGKFVKFDQDIFANIDKTEIIDGVLKHIHLKENNSLEKVAGNYKFINAYKLIKSVQNGNSYEVVSTSDLVCVECIKSDDEIIKNVVKDLNNNSLTTWSDSELTKKYTLLKADQYIDCSAKMCVTIGAENNSYITKAISQADCELYIKDNKLFNSNYDDVCDSSRFLSTIDPQHLKDIVNKINSVKSLTVATDSPLSTKKYVHKLGTYKLEKEDLLNVLEDRFRMLYETTKNNIYFVPLSMPIKADGKQYFYNKETVDKLTKEVFESCGLGDNDVLLVLPFDSSKDTKCQPLGIAKKGSTVLSDEEIKGLTGNWDTKVLQLFAKVSKPLTVSSYYLTATGRIVRFSKKSSGNIKGYSAIKVLQFFESKGYAEVNQLNKELNLCKDPITFQSCKDMASLYKPFLERQEAIYYKYFNLELASGGMQSKNIWNEISKDDIGKLREPFMDDSKITDQIFIDSKVNWTWYAQVKISLNDGSNLDAKKHFYDFDKLKVLDDVVYSTLDAVGTIPGFDTFTDPAGAIYAGVRSDKVNMVIYGTSAMIPFAGSVYIKGSVHEAKQAAELWGVVAKKADNVDGFVFDVKKISDIQADEFHVSSLGYGNEKELAEKIKTEALKDANDFIDKKNVKNAVDNLANNLSSLLSKIEKLPNLSATEKKALKVDLNTTEELKNLFVKNADQTDELAGAWKKLKDSDRTGLMKKALALEAFIKTSKNAKLKELGFTDELLAKVSGYTDASFAELMEDLDILGKHLATNNIKIDNFTSVINILKGENANYRQGVHWIIEDLGKELAFKGKSLKLELRVDNARETFSFIDLACKNCASNGKDILIEYKSGAGSVTKETIQKQFIERDLFTVNSLEEIQWRLKNTTLTKDKLVGWLKENKEALNKLLNDSDRKIKMKKWFDLSDFETTITDTKIEEFVNLNYNAIFK